MSFDPTKPHDALHDLPPEADIETKVLLKACIEARSALSELKGMCARIPNPKVLINTIPLLEAQGSSEIENIVTTSDALFRYVQAEEETDDPATKEALRYRSALQRGFLAIKDRPIGTNTAVEICTRLKGTSMQIRKIPGTALVRAGSGEVIYTPPNGEALLRDKMANWEKFMHECTEIDPLIRMAVAHYQFEAIHPFIDGNGRTGRVLNLLLLVHYGLLDTPVLYLSRYILANRAEYYARLLAVTLEQAWEPWIAFMLQAITDTARWTSAKIAAIVDLQNAATEFVRQRARKIYSHELVDIIFQQPYCRIQNLVEADVAKRQTASAYLKELADLGVLREIRIGRELLFIHPNFIRLLTSEDHQWTGYGET